MLTPIQILKTYYGYSSFRPLQEDMWEQYYTSTETNFEAAKKFMGKNNLIERFLPRIQQVLAWSAECGWGFCDSMPDLFYEYYQKKI